MTLSAALCAALGTAIVLLELLLGLLKGPELGLVLSASTGGPLGPPGPQHVGQGVSVLLCVVRYQLLGPE